MGRILAGISACLLLIIGATLMWRGNAQTIGTPPPPAPRLAAAITYPPTTLAPIVQAPSADPKSKEEKRFVRADKNDDGRITLAELLNRSARHSPSSTSTKTAS